MDVKKLKVLISLTVDDGDYQTAQAKAAHEAAKRLGLSIEIVFAENDAIQQSQQLLTAIQGPANSRPDVIMFEPVGDSLHFTQETTNQGFNTSETIKVEYTAKIDGKDYPIMNSGLDTVALKKIDATTYQRIGKIQGMQTETATMKLSNRNKTLTIATKGTTDTGAEYARTEVFNKQ